MIEEKITIRVVLNPDDSDMVENTIILDMSISKGDHEFSAAITIPGHGDSIDLWSVDPRLRTAALAPFWPYVSQIATTLTDSDNLREFVETLYEWPDE